MTAVPFTLVKAADHTAWNDAIADGHGGRVGLSAVLTDLNRSAAHRIVPVSTAAYGFRWDKADVNDTEWWPQGISHSGDAGPIDTVDGRRVVVVSWYAKPVGDAPSRGSRVSFIDITDLAAPRYRHVLLVQPGQDKESGALSWRPVRLHVGGIAWYGRTLLVADTGGGVRVFGLDDIVKSTAADVPGADLDGGHSQYVLPQRTAYRQVATEGFEKFRFSFLSIDRTDTQPRLDIGEYGSNSQTNRLASFMLGDDGLAIGQRAVAEVGTTGRTRLGEPRGVTPDAEDDTAPDAARLTDDAQAGAGAGSSSDEGRSTLAAQLSVSRGHVQGAVTVKGTTYLSTSRGRFRRGSMYTGTGDGPFHEHRATLSVGCEDLAYWPQRDQIWSVSEYPRHRFVYAMPRGAFDD
jgi:hypothetical protein